MRWGEIAVRFNRRFEGRILPGADIARPSRTKVSLRIERFRVKSITNHTGLPFRKPERRGGSKQAPRKPESEDEKRSSDEEEKSDSEDDGEEEQSPTGTRRGDPPPRKQPWRKDGHDEDDRGGQGVSQPILSGAIGA